MIANKDPKLDEQLKKLWRQAEERKVQRAADAAGIPYTDLTQSPIQAEAFKLLPVERARALQAVVFEHRGLALALGAVNPRSTDVQALISEFQEKGMRVALFEISTDSLAYALKFYAYLPKAAADISSHIDLAPERVSELQKQLVTISDVARLLTEMVESDTATGEVLSVVLAGALTNRASDIHLEAGDSINRLRYRIDGTLQTVFEGLPAELYGMLVSRIKLLANLRLNITTTSQDGRFTLLLGQNPIELRISIIPSEFGEGVVMRVLDPRAIEITLTDLGLRSDDLEIIKRELESPNGMILNTGPTGSGKTTTLYAFLRSIASPETKIITIEDPIEYHLQNIEQTQVDTASGYTFANGLRSIMRQDPDIILVGEIRDQETADIGIQAALTGHLVFSTLHTNSASGVIPRLLDLGAPVTSIGPALNLVIAQRLVRKLCEHCKEAVAMTPELTARVTAFLKQLPARVSISQLEPALYQAHKNPDGSLGCKLCHATGYMGRTGIFELLRIDEAFEELISKRAGEGEISRAALAQGMVTLQQDALLRALAGQTSLEEVVSVTGPLKDF